MSAERQPKKHGAMTLSQKWSDFCNRVRTVGRAYINYYTARLIGKPKKVVLCYPEKPARYYHVLYAVCNKLGYEITNDPTVPADIVIAFEDTTVRKNDEILTALNKTQPVINFGAADIGKDRVDEIFTSVFGYSTRIDPRTHQGEYVKKSIANTAHDGVILTTPTEPEPGYIYQKLIDTRLGDKVIDIRVPIFGSIIPFVVLRYKSISNRFDHTLRTIMHPKDEFLSADEQEKIIAFCKAFGLECGELDILRDNADGRIYIVDANNTSGSPRPGIQMLEKEYRVFLKRLAEAFERAFGDMTK